MASHPWRWIAAALAVFVVFPTIDLTVSSWFYEPGQHVFVARSWGPAEFVRRKLPAVLIGLAAVVAVLWLAGEVSGRVFLGIGRRAAGTVLLSLALGPGLLVNVIFKDHWGRPRPSTILEFGGSKYYTAPFAITDQCDYNCSFPSGHAALGFWVVSLALLAPPRWRVPAMIAALGTGIAVGAVRVAQGGHFVSDVFVSGVITIGVCIWVHRWLMGSPNNASAKNISREDGESS